MTRVLIVDGVIGRRNLMATLLTEQGIETIETDNIAAAQVYVEKLKICVIVLDPLVSRTQGYDFYQQLQATTETQSIPIIVLTNFSPETIQRVFSTKEQGPVLYLRDPIKAEQLIKLVQSLI